jgi:hypothetical protein
MSARRRTSVAGTSTRACAISGAASGDIVVLTSSILRCRGALEVWNHSDAANGMTVAHGADAALSYRRRTLHARYWVTNSATVRLMQLLTRLVVGGLMG